MRGARPYVTTTSTACIHRARESQARVAPRRRATPVERSAPRKALVLRWKPPRPPFARQRAKPDPFQRRSSTAIAAGSPSLGSANGRGSIQTGSCPDIGQSHGRRAPPSAASNGGLGAAPRPPTQPGATASANYPIRAAAPSATPARASPAQIARCPIS